MTVLSLTATVSSPAPDQTYHRLRRSRQSPRQAAGPFRRAALLGGLRAPAEPRHVAARGVLRALHLGYGRPELLAQLLAPGLRGVPALVLVRLAFALALEVGHAGDEARVVAAGHGLGAVYLPGQWLVLFADLG